MIPHPLIRTGFDFELQFGGPYFLSIIQAAYDAGLIPQTVDLTPGNPVAVQRPHDAFVLTGQDEVNLAVSYSGFYTLCRSVF
ncbi:MAG: hypothetical protein ACI959_000061 [Limisphaerales bacterium]|jgi:hypothetical protein